MSHRSGEPDELTDETAVRRVLAGRREAFAPLLRRHRPGVLGLCRGILGSEAEAQDVVQEASLQAFLNLDRLREPALFGAWLHSIAANLARSALRRRRPDVAGRSAGFESLADAAPTPEEVRLARELHDEVISALGGLSAVNREAVVGYYLEGYSYRELAGLLGVPVSTVKGRLYKGRRQLEPALAPVAREVLGRHREREEVGVNNGAAGMVEVVVDDVVKVGFDDERGLEMLRAGGSLGGELREFGGEQERMPAAVVVLREVDGERVVPIWVGLAEGLSIWVSVSGRRMPRPMTHDLMGRLMQTAGLRVTGVAVNRLAEGTFYGEISLTGDESQTHEVDARPSDAVALAVRLEAPIRVAGPVFEEGGHESKASWLKRGGPDMKLPDAGPREP